MVFEVVPRDQWGAAPPRQPPTRVDFPVLKVVFTYHTGALSCSNREQCCKELRSIQANHFKRGMTDIAYNFLVGGHGEAYEGRGWGVLPSSQLKLRFGDRVDIAFIGNFTQDTLPGKVFRSSLQLISLGTKLNYITRQWEIENIQKTYYQKKKPLPKANVPHYKKKVVVIDPLLEDNDDVVGEGKLRSKRKYDMDEIQDELGFANNKVTNNDFSRFDKQVDRMAKEQKSNRDVLANDSEDSLGNNSNLEFDSDDINSDEDDVEDEFKFDDDEIFEQFEPEGPGEIYDSKPKAQSKSNKKLKGENDLTFDQDFDYDEEEFTFNEQDFKFNKSASGKSNLKREIKSTPDRQKQKDILQCLDKFGFDEEAFKFGKKYSLQVDRPNDISAVSSFIQKNKVKSNTQKLKFDNDFKFDKEALNNKKMSNAKLNRRKVTSGNSDLKHDGYFDSREEGLEFDKRIPQPRHKVKLKNDNFDDDLGSDDSDLKVKDNFDRLKTVKANNVDIASLSKHKRNPKTYKHSLKFLNDQLNIDDLDNLDQKDFKIKKDRFKAGQPVDDDIVKTLIEKYGKSKPESTKIENRTSKVRKNINSDTKYSKPTKTDLKSEKSHTDGVDGKSDSKKNIDFDDEDIPRFDEKDFQMDTNASYYDGNELKFDEKKLMNDPDLFFDDEQIYVNKP